MDGELRLKSTVYALIFSVPADPRHEPIRYVAKPRFDAPLAARDRRGGRTVGVDAIGKRGEESCRVSRAFCAIQGLRGSGEADVT